MKIITINYFSVFSYLKPKYSQHSIQRKRKRQYKTVFFVKMFRFCILPQFQLFEHVTNDGTTLIVFSLWCHHLVKKISLQILRFFSSFHEFFPKSRAFHSFHPRISHT